MLCVQLFKVWLLRAANQLKANADGLWFWVPFGAFVNSVLEGIRLIKSHVFHEGTGCLCGLISTRETSESYWESEGMKLGEKLPWMRGKWEARSNRKEGKGAAAHRIFSLLWWKLEFGGGFLTVWPHNPFVQRKQHRCKSMRMLHEEEIVAKSRLVNEKNRTCEEGAKNMAAPI